ncbi:MAG: hypothetical protein QOI74_1703 [Micromonosporaceae bacterium]|jgi:formylmethanofuran dehydrogenase subunit E|nr:hypothetical protein [Micromonosporaceae bacterium]MDT5036083.1 hypothetical protein [Micromonosporaceae bacterium]
MSADDFPAYGPVFDPPGTRVVVHYRQNGILVTNHYFAAGHERYEIPQLSDVVRLRGSSHPGIAAGVIVAALEVVIAVPLLGVVRAPAAWLVVCVAVALPCLIGCMADVVCTGCWPPRHELLATYHGHEVILLTTHNEREFGQVTRALRRAMETDSGRRQYRPAMTAGEDGGKATAR